ncbi:MAG: hypothetical protein E6Q39_01845 [Crocinitomicaceae bacterium]|nr:MAG: hypothetical protein E6Q39_01845 [Crocinitomicaceae bacterium]
MPLNDLIQSHFTPAEVTQVDDLIKQIRDIITPKSRNLTAEENQRYGSINEKNKLLVNKILDYRQAQPDLSSPDVDWTEFEADHFDRQFLQSRTEALNSIIEIMNETKILHDYDNYQNALTDYSYTKYKDETMGGQGYTSKHSELKQFFPNTGGGEPNTEPAPPTP